MTKIKKIKEIKIKRETKSKETVITDYGKIISQTVFYKKQNISRTVYRDTKGRFTKNPYAKYVAQKWRKRARQDKTLFGGQLKTEYYRASIFVEIPYHGHPRGNYYWFGITIIDKPENIDIHSDKIKEELKQLLERELHYNRSNWWFNLYYDYEEKQPYPATRPEKFYQKWSKTRK